MCAIKLASTTYSRRNRFDAVLHLAAQVAVTTSVADPRTDFAVNAFGTFNVLDAVRVHCPEAVFIFASTNKVYGKVAAAKTELRGNRYAYVDRPHGISETEPLDFLSPYGCSKGAADQYALDFARIYKHPGHLVPAVVHLRAASVRCGGSGLGSLVRHRRDPRAATSPSSATASRCATSCMSTTSCVPTRPQSARPTRWRSRPSMSAADQPTCCLCSISSKCWSCASAAR